jgi:hypothetical protein
MVGQDQISSTLAAVFREALDGASPQSGWALNPGDPGLLASLDRLSADEASARPDGRSSIAAHVDHVRYGLMLWNRWAAGESDPFSGANYSASWARQYVTEDEWADLRTALADEAHAWLEVIAQRREWSEEHLTGAVASVVHLAYHFGAMRQIHAALRGPLARD